MGILLVLSLLYDMTGAHGDGLPMGGKTIAGPGNAGIEKAKPAVILTSKIPLPPACIHSHEHDDVVIDCLARRFPNQLHPR